jgi:hypothetical protein
LTDFLYIFILFFLLFVIISFTIKLHNKTKLYAASTHAVCDFIFHRIVVDFWMAPAAQKWATWSEVLHPSHFFGCAEDIEHTRGTGGVTRNISCPKRGCKGAKGGSSHRVGRGKCVDPVPSISPPPAISDKNGSQIQVISVIL